MRTLCLAVLAFGASAAAHAQVAEAYVTANFTHVSNVETGYVQAQTGGAEKFTGITPVGVGGGVTFNFLPLPVARLGFDLRGSTRPGTTGADTALGGIKLTFKPPVLKPKFFVEGAVGYLATRTPNVSSSTVGSQTTTSGGTFGNRYAHFQIIGGVDYPLMHFVDYRVEVAGGRSFGNGVVYNTNQSTDVSLFTVNTGVVLHF